ncbi:BolA/IbaG family iron-sulfur metabolism protein [Candidatus Cyrtobacter comes]|nr:BolA/IbaG family iron-sulfur metabolism protein [Candidatus Cyrtobacter comes]
MASSKESLEYIYKISKLILDSLHYTGISIKDLSHLHRGHAGVEELSHITHIEISLKGGEEKTEIEKHREIYKLLGPHMDAGLHSVSIIS